MFLYLFIILKFSSCFQNMTEPHNLLAFAFHHSLLVICPLVLTSSSAASTSVRLKSLQSLQSLQSNLNMTHVKSDNILFRVMVAATGATVAAL